MMVKNAGPSPGPAACAPTFWNRDFPLGATGVFMWRAPLIEEQTIGEVPDVAG
jgi:hypothetical protein